jgi:hypothetical protein
MRCQGRSPRTEDKEGPKESASFPSALDLKHRKQRYEMTASATIRVPAGEAIAHSGAAIANFGSIARKRHINWALKAMLPIAAVLLNGLLLFILVSLSLAAGERHIVITVATAGAIVICAAVIVVLAVSVRRHMIELQD